MQAPRNQTSRFGSSVVLDPNNALDTRRVLSVRLDNLVSERDIWGPGGWTVALRAENLGDSVLQGRLVWGAGGVTHQSIFHMVWGTTFWVSMPSFDLDIGWENVWNGPASFDPSQPVRVYATAQRNTRGPGPCVLQRWTIPVQAGAKLIQTLIPPFARTFKVHDMQNEGSDHWHPGAVWRIGGGGAGQYLLTGPQMWARMASENPIDVRFAYLNNLSIPSLADGCPGGGYVYGMYELEL